MWISFCLVKGGVFTVNYEGRAVMEMEIKIGLFQVQFSYNINCKRLNGPVESIYKTLQLLLNRVGCQQNLDLL